MYYFIMCASLKFCLWNACPCMSIFLQLTIVYLKWHTWEKILIFYIQLVRTHCACMSNVIKLPKVTIQLQSAARPMETKLLQFKFVKLPLTGRPTRHMWMLPSIDCPLWIPPSLTSNISSYSTENMQVP